MTRQPYDQFSKQYLSVLFKAFGKIEISQEVSSEIRFVDFSFSPAPEQHENFTKLGLLGKMGAKSSLFEPFRNQPSFSQIRSCVLKLFAIYSELERKARREKYSLAEADLPLLWILVPSASDNLLDTFGFELKLEQWDPGVYFTDEGFKTGLVAINRLPNNRETLWLRILGKGTTQQQAISQLLELPRTAPFRNDVLEEIARLQILLEKNKKNATNDDLELIMTFSEAYTQWREDTLQQGREQERQQARRERQLLIENLLKVRFGNIDSALAEIISPLLELPSEESARLLIELSRDELLTRFENNRN